MKNSIKTFIRITAIFLFLMAVGCSNKDKKNMDKKSDQESYTMEDFKSVPKIDTHAHIQAEGKIFVTEARANNFRLMVMTVDVADYYLPMEEQVSICIKQHQEDPDIIAFTTAFTLEGWEEPDWADKIIVKLQRNFDNGALGIKTWKNIGMVERDKDGNLIMLDDPKFDPIFKFVKDQNKVMLSHAGEPKNCWLPLENMTVKNDYAYFSEHPEFHMYLHPEMPSYEDQINARNNMLEKNRDLTFISAHLASLEWSVDEIAAFLDRFPNARVDLAERLSHLQAQSLKDRKKVRDFIIKYQDRILYGTDFEELADTKAEELRAKMQKIWHLDWKYFNTDEMMTVPQLDDEFQGLKLPKIVVDKIYHINAEKAFGDAWATTKK